jgi:PIN domain
MIKVVLDTNVVVSANLVGESPPAAILDLAVNRKILMCFSPAMPAEYEEVLHRPRLKLDYRQRRPLPEGLQDYPDHRAQGFPGHIPRPVAPPVRADLPRPGSEVQLRPDLDLPRTAAHRIPDPAEQRTGDVRGRRAERDRVRQVRSVRPKLQLEPLVDRDPLQ